MFGLTRSDKRKDRLGRIAAGLASKLTGMHPVERAGVLLLANCVLDLTGRLHGEALTDNPRAAGTQLASAALDDLLPALDKLATLAADDRFPHQRHVRCHMAATELAAVTIGLGLVTSPGRLVAQCWKSAWDARAQLRRTIIWVRQYERIAETEAVPRLANGDIPSDVDLLPIGSRVPAFLRRRS